MQTSLNPAAVEFVVFLDRDGVINRNLPGDRFVCHWNEFEFLPGVPDAIRALNRSSIRVIVVTNQRGVSLGLYTENELQCLHARMTSELLSGGARLDAIYYCPHSKKQCTCRKPGTALFEQAFRDFPRVKPATSILIGDSLSDMQAAHKLGCKKVLIADHGGAIAQKARESGIKIEFSSNSLIAAVRDFVLPNFDRSVPL